MKPPKRALMLLRLFVPGRDDLAGDLLEQFLAGKSELWLWTQVLAAIVTASGRQLRADRIGAVEAVALGWASMLIFFFIAGDLLAHSADQTVPRLLG